MHVNRTLFIAFPFILLGCNSSTGDGSSGSNPPAIDSSVTVTTSIEGTVQTPGSPPSHFTTKPGINNTAPTGINRTASEPRTWNCGIAGLADFKPKFPENEKLVTLDKLPDGNYVLTQFSVYFSEPGRNHHPGQARLIYQLKQPGSLIPADDFYYGLSSENDQNTALKDFSLDTQIDPAPRVINGNLVYNPASTLHLKSIQDKNNASLRYLSDPSFDNRAAFNPQDLFNSKRLVFTNTYLIPSGFFSLTDTRPIGGVVPKGNGFELYIGQATGIWGEDGSAFNFVMTYEKPGAPSVRACESSQSRIEKIPVQK